MFCYCYWWKVLLFPQNWHILESFISFRFIPTQQTIWGSVKKWYLGIQKYTSKACDSAKLISGGSLWCQFFKFLNLKLISSFSYECSYATALLKLLTRNTHKPWGKTRISLFYADYSLCCKCSLVIVLSILSYGFNVKAIIWALYFKIAVALNVA